MGRCVFCNLFLNRCMHPSCTALRHHGLRLSVCLYVSVCARATHFVQTAEGHKNFKFEDEFVNMGVLGKGSFSVVYQVR